MDHGPPSQNAPDAKKQKKEKKVVQTTLNFKQGKVKGFADQFLPDLDRMFQGHSGKVELSL